MTTTRRFAYVAALASTACSQKPVPPPVDAAPPAPLSASSADVDRGAPTDASLDAGSDAHEGGAEAPPPVYSREGIAPLAPDCQDPQAVLGVWPYDDRSFLRRIQQAMVAHPEIEVVTSKPGAQQVKLSESQYGTKFFARHRVERNHYAVIADCGDTDTCLDIAALAKAAVPDARPELFCHDPPAISGQKQALRGPWRLPTARPDPKERVEVCARLTACAIRAAAATGGAAWRACGKAPLGDAARCASLEGCAEVVRCSLASGLL